MDELKEEAKYEIELSMKIERNKKELNRLQKEIEEIVKNKC